jgi:tetratricopeptide (TPR) repeat protein
LYPLEAKNMRISTILLCAGLLLARQSSADDDVDKAKKEMAAGGKDFVSGNCKSALIHFTAASNYAPTAAGPHRELGKTLECLEKYEEAKREYEIYLQIKPDAADAAEVKGYIQDVEKKIAETTPDNPLNTSVVDGKLTFSVDKGAKIFVDDKALEKAQIKNGYALSPGKYTVRVEKKGFETLTTEVEVLSGETFAVKEALVPTANKEASNEPEGSGKSKIPAYASFGVAAAGIGLGVFAGLQALQVNDELALLQDQPIPLDEFDDLVKQGQLFNILTIGGYSLAGLSAGVGVFLLIRSGKSSGEAEAKKLQVMPTIGGFTAKLSF